MVPFLNKVVQNFEKKEFQYLVGILFFLFTVLSSFLLNSAFEYIGWYVTVYLMGAYLRLHPIEFLKNTKICFLFSTASLALCYASVIFIILIGTRMNRNLPVYWFVNDSNKILAISTAIALFCLFKSLKIGHIKIINTLAASTFGFY